MEIILLERVENLGQMGDLVTVKPGYARNFLLPKGKAIRATAENREKFDADRAQLEADNLAKKGEAEKAVEKMNGLTVQLIRAASEMGQLYGSASSRDIAQAVSESGFTIVKTQVDLNTAIKTLGLFPVRLVLHPEVSVEVTVNIARSVDEAEEQQRLGRASSVMLQNASVKKLLQQRKKLLSVLPHRTMKTLMQTPQTAMLNQLLKTVLKTHKGYPHNPQIFMKKPCFDAWFFFTRPIIVSICLILMKIITKIPHQVLMTRVV